MNRRLHIEGLGWLISAIAILKCTPDADSFPAQPDRERRPALDAAHAIPRGQHDHLRSKGATRWQSEMTRRAPRATASRSRKARRSTATSIAWSTTRWRARNIAGTGREGRPHVRRRGRVAGGRLVRGPKRRLDGTLHPVDHDVPERGARRHGRHDVAGVGLAAAEGRQHGKFLDGPAVTQNLTNPRLLIGKKPRILERRPKCNRSRASERRFGGVNCGVNKCNREFLSTTHLGQKSPSTNAESLFNQSRQTGWINAAPQLTKANGPRHFCRGPLPSTEAGFLATG